MKFKYDNMSSKIFTSVGGILAILISLGTFLTGKRSLTSFFGQITAVTFAYTLGYTFLAYLSLMCFVVFFILAFLIDFFTALLLPDFWCIKLLYSLLIENVVVNWWNNTLPEARFLAVAFLFIISSVRIETNKYVYSLFFDSWGKKKTSFQVGLISKSGMPGGVYIGFLLKRAKVRENL